MSMGKHMLSMYLVAWWWWRNFPFVLVDKAGSRTTAAPGAHVEIIFSVCLKLWRWTLVVFRSSFVLYGLPCKKIPSAKLGLWTFVIYLSFQFSVSLLLKANDKQTYFLLKLNVQSIKDNQISFFSLVSLRKMSFRERIKSQHNKQLHFLNFRNVVAAMFCKY